MQSMFGRDINLHGDTHFILIRPINTHPNMCLSCRSNQFQQQKHYVIINGTETMTNTKTDM